MVTTQKIFDEIHDHIKEVIAQSEPVGAALWAKLLKAHPADIAEFINALETEDAQAIFTNLGPELRLEIFDDLDHTVKVPCLAALNDADRAALITNLSIDELTDFFDELSDEELKNYLKLLHTKDRETVLSLLQFSDDVAAGIMHTSVLTLMQDFTVEKSIQILQRLQPNRDLHQQIFVTNQDNKLVGHIQLEDLVLKAPQSRVVTFMRPNELILNAMEDKEKVAQDMLHYHTLIAPVVDNEQHFLGVITGDTLVEVIGEEATEDIYRISALSPMKETYFQTPFLTLLYQRSSILMILLLVQSLSSTIIQAYEATLAGFFILFITKLTSAGGNASSQTSALAIQGLTTGEIDDDTIKKFIRREFLMATIIGVLLGIATFGQIYYSHQTIAGATAVSASLAIIVMVSVLLGSSMPFILQRFNVDPANAAGPLLATLMDVIGLLIYCIVSSSIHGYMS